jgi:hypothetical protein
MDKGTEMKIKLRLKNYLRYCLPGLFFVFCFLPFLSAETPELHQLLAKVGVQELRRNLQAELDALVLRFGREQQKIEQLPLAELQVKKAQLRRVYGQERDQILLRYRQYDKRSEEINIIRKELNGQVVNTGSYPKNPLADVDLAALSDADAHQLAGAWKKIYGDDKVIFNGYKYVNTETDTTLWLPNTDERMSAKLGDADAFFTSGGLKKTGVRDALTNELGWFLDNEQKFLHAIDPEGGNHDLKTVGKSLSKVMESNDGYKGVGVGDGDPQYAGRVREQAKILQNYGDIYKAGIADFGDSPEQVKQKTKVWLQEAMSVMDSESNKSAHRSHFQVAAQDGLVNSLSDVEAAWRLKDRIEVSDYQNLLQSRRNMAMREKLPFQGSEPVYFDSRYAAHFASESGVVKRSFGKTETRAILRVEKLPETLRSREYGKEKIVGLMSTAVDIFDPVSFLNSKLSASPHSSSRIVKMGSALVLLGLYANYNRLKAEAENAANINISLRENNEALKNARIFGAALMETTGAPEFMRNLGDAISKEFDQADKEEFIAQLTLVGARIFAASADATIFQPVTEILEAFVGFKDLAQTVWSNFADGFRIREEERLRGQALGLKRAQAAAFNLSEISMALGDFGGPPVVRPLSNQDIITFEARPNQNWTTAYLAEWMLLNPFGAKVEEFSVGRVASEPLASRHGFMVQEFPTASYAVMLRISELAGGNFVDWRRVEFEVEDPPQIGRIVMYQAVSGSKSGGVELKNPVDRGIRIVFHAHRLGLWPESGVSAEWFIDGELYKVKGGLEPESNLLTLNTGDLSSGTYQVSFRLVEKESGKIISHQRLPLVVGKKEDGQRDEKKPDDEKDISSTAGRVLNQDISTAVGVEQTLSDQMAGASSYHGSQQNYAPVLIAAPAPAQGTAKSNEGLEIEVKYGLREKKSSPVPVGGLTPVDWKYQTYYRQFKGQPGKTVPLSAPLLRNAKGEEKEEVYHGFREIYYKGFLVQKGQYVNGLKEGEWRWFHPESRQLVRIENFKNDRRLSWFEFNSEGYLLGGEDRERNVFYSTNLSGCDHERVLSRKSPHMESSANIENWKWRYSQGKDLYTPGAHVIFSRMSKTDDCTGVKPGISSGTGLRKTLGIYDPQQNTDVYVEEICNVDGKVRQVQYHYNGEHYQLILEPEDAYVETSQPPVSLSNYQGLFAAMYSYLSKESGSAGAKNPRQLVENYNKKQAEKKKDGDKKDKDDKDEENDPAKKELYKKLQPYFEQYKKQFINTSHYHSLFRKELMSIFQIGLDLASQQKQVCNREKQIKARLSHLESVRTGSPEYNMMMEIPDLQKKCVELTKKEQIWDEAFKQFDAISDHGQRVYALKNHQALNQNFNIKTEGLSAAVIKLQDAMKALQDAKAVLKTLGGKPELEKGELRLKLE